MDPTPETLLPVLPRPDALQQIEQFLQEIMTPEEAAPPAPPRRGRPTVLPALCLWLGMVVCVLRGHRYQRDLWRLLAHGGLWSIPVIPISDDAVYARLDAEGVAPMQQLFTQVSQVLAERLAPYAARDLAPFAAEVVALDESTLERLARRLPALRALPPGDPALLGGAIAGLFDLRRQQWRTIVYRTNWQQNEKVAARAVIASLPPGSLILADLGYFGFQWFDDLTDSKHFWISRLRSKTSFDPIHIYYQDETTLDAIVWLGAYRADRAKHAVRLVQFTIGSVQYQYITNVLDPHTLSLRQIAGLYQRRWDFELAINTVKTHLGVHLLWSSKPVVIEQQVVAALILAQILQALRLEIAGRAQVDPFEVSLALMIRYLPDLVALGQDPIEAFLTNARAVGFIRASSRTKNLAPEIDPGKLRPLPPGLVLERKPRSAERNCGPCHDRDAPSRN